MQHVFEKSQVHQKDEITHEFHGGRKQRALGKTQRNTVFAQNFLT